VSAEEICDLKLRNIALSQCVTSLTNVLDLLSGASQRCFAFGRGVLRGAVAERTRAWQERVRSEAEAGVQLLPVTPASLRARASALALLAAGFVASHAVASGAVGLQSAAFRTVWDKTYGQPRLVDRIPRDGARR